MKEIYNLTNGKSKEKAPFKRMKLASIYYNISHSFIKYRYIFHLFPNSYYQYKPIFCQAIYKKYYLL